MFRNLMFSLLVFFCLFFVSCKDDTNSPNDVNNSNDSGRCVYYTKNTCDDQDCSLDSIQIRRYNFETGKDELFMRKAILIGIVGRTVYYEAWNSATQEIIVHKCDSKGNNDIQLFTILLYKFYTPVLSPDGSKILYYSRLNENTDDYNICCSNIDGTINRVIYSSSGFELDLPMAAFTADSKKIGISEQQFDHIYLFTSNTDGINIKQENIVNGFGLMGGGLSPDGKYFAYNSLEGYEYDYYDEFDSTDIAVYDFAGKQSKKITVDGNNAFILTWSPDGSKLAFVNIEGAVCIINSDGSNIKEITNIGAIGIPILWYLPWYDITMTWTADGKELLLHYPDPYADDSYTLRLVNTETKAERIIVSGVIGNAYMME